MKALQATIFFQVYTMAFSDDRVVVGTVGHTFLQTDIFHDTFNDFLLGKAIEMFHGY